MTIHATPRDELDQTEHLNGTTPDDEHEDRDATSPSERPETDVLAQHDSIMARRAMAIAEYDAELAAVNAKLDGEIAATREKLARLEAIRNGSPVAASKAPRAPRLAKAKAAEPGAPKARKRGGKESNKAKVLGFVAKHPKSLVKEIAAELGLKSMAVSQILNGAKGKKLVKSTGDRPNMKWSTL